MRHNIEVKRKENEPRLNYLMRVLKVFMEQTPAGENSIIYDEARCDGLCLVKDFEAEVDIHLPDDEDD